MADASQVEIRPDHVSTLAIAREYLRRGWQPVPVPLGEKAPKQNGWQVLEITEANIANVFDRTGNIGILLGGKSGGLTDVDLDCPEALALADVLLPETPAVFGRSSKPRSHRLFNTELYMSEQKAAVRYVEPQPLARDPAKSATLVELRIGGGDKAAQTIFPGSTHPSGETVEWEEEGSPVAVEGADLKWHVAALAAGALLVRHYPAQGARHESALVLGGTLARADWLMDDIKLFVSAVARAAGDEEADERGLSAAEAVGLLERGEPTPGLPRMREIWGVELVDTVVQWLDLSQQKFGDGDDKIINDLVRLDLLAYERQRDSAAKKLGITRISVLDKLVADRRTQQAAAEADADFLRPVEPWPEPVDGGKLLDELCDVFDRHVMLSPGTAEVLALWTLHAHAHDAATHSPILDIWSPEKRCGKTQLLTVLSMLVPKPLSAANVTPATVFRSIKLWRPTILMDEMDTYISDKSELRGVLNSGHTRSQAFVLRCVGDDLVPTQFSTWCPKVFAHIGRVHGTLEDRSILISLRRKLKSEKVERIPKNAHAYSDLSRKCARWAADNMERLKQARPQLPDINDRAQDNWEPLLAIAEACDPNWSGGRDIAVKLSGVDDDDTDGIVLLRDLKALFARERNKHLSSAEIVAELSQMEERKWPEYKAGKPITPTNVARLLKPFGIRPRKVDAGGGRQVQGYGFKQFEATFRRYVDDSPPTDGRA